MMHDHLQIIRYDLELRSFYEVFEPRSMELCK